MIIKKNNEDITSLLSGCEIFLTIAGNDFRLVPVVNETKNLETASAGTENIETKFCDFESAPSIAAAEFSPIAKVALSAPAAQAAEPDPAHNRDISNVLLMLNIPPHIKGYSFMREAIFRTIQNPKIITRITKELYPNIADRFETTASKVERAIRHAIEVCWQRSKIETINQVFGVRQFSIHDKPTNGEFIALVADKLLLDGIKIA
ncbi:MAG: sporulation initiation factor Spo0A C-terminal domain-containing protein [Christensenellaceae bacterium]|jgi:hypothetical protein|nr:sporulation initiation factor Spo0A C-terminal domain-containing protein [Christensenellaceae bacterium]